MKLFLIDGHALIFKMYYAFLGRHIVNSRGVDTSILFGFTKYLLELVERERPTHLAVSFDPPGGTFRNSLYPEYKANRAETPQLVIDALEPLTGIVRAMNVPVLMVPGYEADDVIGTAAKRFASDGLDVFMVTPDKDYGQLVGPHIWQYRPGKSGSDNEILGEAEVCAKWKISSASQVIDMLTLCGDSSDNVPGVQGVGPVGAAKLLSQYSSVDGIYEHLDELTPRQQQLFRAAGDHMALSRELVTIRTDVPLELGVDDMKLGNVRTAELEALMDEYEFPSLKRILQKLSPEAPAPVSASAAPAVPELRAVAPSGIGGSRVALNLKSAKLYVAADGKCAAGSPGDFRALLEDAAVIKVGAGLKSQMNALADAGVELRGRLEDVELMHYLLNPESSHSLGRLAMGYLGVALDDAGPAEPAGLFDDAPAEDESGALRETAVLLPLADRLNAEIDRTEGMRRLYDEIEEPLLSVLSRMERTGVKVDLDSLRDYAAGLRREMLEKEAAVREIAGDPQFNVSSPRQIGALVYEKLKLAPKAKKPKSGNWPTDERTLLELGSDSPVIDLILDCRGLRKLLSTYIEPFAGYISPRDGRVHTTFNQTLTSTGRLSSSNPNLQNIPIRTDQGREIRRAFVAGSPGSVMMSADYSQIELRIMAHLSQDEHLVAAFRAGHDIHAATAARIFGVKLEDVSADQRRTAKTVNFGIMYGMSSFGLSQRLHCAPQEAKKIIDDYFSTFPSIRGFIDRTLAGARENGYVETMFGRRRYIPDLRSNNANVRALAERNAVNAPIQGTAADIIKLAMNHVDRRLREDGLQSRMVLQIHDELLLEVPEGEIGAVRSLLVEEMENVISLSVPLTVECNYGKNWLEAH